MTIEMHESARDDEIVDAEIIDVEEPGRGERARQWAADRRTRTSAEFAEQRARVARRLQIWFTTEDVTDAALAEAVERRRRQSQQGRETEIRARITGLRRQMKHAEPDQVAGLATQIATAETRLDMVRGADDADRMKVDATSMSRARWARKAGRLASAVGVAILAVKGITLEPLTALAALGAAAAGWWYLARPLTDGEAAAVPAQAGTVGAPGSAPVGAPGVVLVDQATGETVTVPGPVEPFVPDSLADLGRVSLIKRASGRVQGEADLVTALVKAGIISEGQRDETHIAGVIEPSGPGWTATVELPRGMKGSAAVARVEEFASALRLKKSQIEMRSDTSEDGHEGRFVLWVANEANPYGSKVVSSPLLGETRWDLWQGGVPLGTDPRGGRHTLDLVWSSLLLGGLPGFGKSYLARLIAAGAVLDPSVTIHMATGKPGPDWAPLKRVARSYVAGNTSEKILGFLDLLNDLIADMREVGERLEELSEEHPEQCPEGKLTTALAAEWGRGLTLLVVDELQEFLDAAAMLKIKTDDDPESKDRGRNGRDVLVETMARFVRVSRYAGGMALFITQRPDASSVPTMLREVCAKRASFRVKGVASSKMVLGDDAVAAGAAPHMLLDSQKGVVVLDQGGEEGHITFKSDLMTVPEFREICLRGRQLRVEAGTLDGFAAEYGKADVKAAGHRGLLDDCLHAMEVEGVDRARTQRLVELLQSHPGPYNDLTAAQLQQQLRDAGAGTTRKLGPLDGMANPNGYTREQIAEARK
ncbi:hypothetical protein ACFXAZ_34415 [Streptomyces sp. NPDC059477]|uniref:hypothetical protein n=1 Tax=Streptomyces sp. NPDC059477 TaxID=3346847 RepID=UPI0036AFDEF6